MPDNDERQDQILDAAVAVIIRLGYDKTTMNDIADEAGVSRGTVYLYFKGKEELFEALIYREWMQYARKWLEYVEADPRGGTIGSVYRGSFRAINSLPLMASMLRRDRRMIGNYLRKPDNLFAWLQAGSTNTDFIQALQAVGAVRQNIDPVMMAHIIDMLSYGYLVLGDYKPVESFPPDEQVLEALADMMDRLLLPEDGGNIEAGKAVIRQIANAAMEQIEQAKRAKDSNKKQQEKQ